MSRFNIIVLAILSVSAVVHIAVSASCPYASNLGHHRARGYEGDIQYYHGRENYGKHSYVDYKAVKSDIRDKLGGRCNNVERHIGNVIPQQTRGCISL